MLRMPGERFSGGDFRYRGRGYCENPSAHTEQRRCPLHAVLLRARLDLVADVLLPPSWMGVYVKHTSLFTRAVVVCLFFFATVFVSTTHCQVSSFPYKCGFEAELVSGLSRALNGDYASKICGEPV
jgi:hypothetical protein